MKLIIAGGRDYQFTQRDEYALGYLRHHFYIEEVVSGGAGGADKCGEEWAMIHGIPVKKFVADWDKHGKAAGPLRNEEMAKYASALVAFPGGRGTANMVKQAKKHRINILDWRS